MKSTFFILKDTALVARIGVDDLRHPACESMYVGGHEDRNFPFMENSETEVL